MAVAKLRDIVKQLRDLGHTVETYQRMDIQGRKRGIVIRSIDGRSFKGSKGNEIARQLVGAQLSQYQKEQMERLNEPKQAVNKLPVAKRRKEPLPEDVVKKLRKIQREYRKKGKEYGIPTTAKYRCNLKNKGKEEADRLLEEASRYVKGLAYSEAISTFIQRLTQTLSDIFDERAKAIMKDIIKKISDYPENKFTFKQLNDITDAFYNFVNSPSDIVKAITSFKEAVDTVLV